MFKKLLIFSAVLFLSFPFLVGCGSADDPVEEEPADEEVVEDEDETLTFSEARVELTVENVIVDHREDMEVRDRGEHGVDMMLDDQIFININPMDLALDALTLAYAEGMAEGMGLDPTELESLAINDRDAFLVQGLMDEMPGFKLSVVMFLANDYLYAMGYMASEEEFDLYYPYFVEIRESTREVEVLTSEDDIEVEVEEVVSEDDIEVEEETPLEPVTLFAGDWKGGADVPVGRWIITGTGSGNFTIWRGSNLHVNEILGSSGGFGVASITTDIADGDEIGISGLSDVTFTHVAKRETSTVLSTGHWVVGEDIEAGSFDATAPSGSGNFTIWRGNSLRTNEILGDGSFGVERVRVNLSNGDRISISGLERVDFEEND